MKKRITTLISLIVCLALTLSSVGICGFAAEAKGEIIISFVLGENEIEILGEKKAFEAPYAVGSGIILVPSEVIAKAFDVSVMADDEKDGIVVLTHPEVEIVLEIGSILADVNGLAEIMPAAPEIKNNSLMIPLRYIAETYGAEVNYNSESSLITVSALAEEETGTIIEGGIESPRIGNSKYNWSIENASDMTVTNNRGNGTFTRLESDSFEKRISINVEDLKEDYDFERDYYNKRYSVEDKLLYSMADDTDPSKRTIRIKEKTALYYYDTYIIVTDKYYYYLEGFCITEAKDDIESISRIISSFDTVFNKEDTHDLYKEKSFGTYENFEDEKLKLSFDLPSYFENKNISNYDNALLFLSEEEGYENSQIYLNIYAKEEGFGASELANRNYEIASLYYNTDVVKVSDKVKEVKYENINGYEYDFECRGKYDDSYVRKLFFETGDFIYYLYIQLELSTPKVKSQADHICNSFKGEIIEDEEFDKVLYNVPGINDDTYLYKGDGWEIAIPKSYVVIGDEESADLSLISGAVNITVDLSDTSVKSMEELRRSFDEFKELESYFDNYEMVKPLSRRMIGKNQYFEFAFSIGFEESNEVQYMHILSTYRNGRVISFSLMTYEETYSQKVLDDIYEMVKSLKFVK